MRKGNKEILVYHARPEINDYSNPFRKSQSTCVCPTVLLGIKMDYQILVNPVQSKDKREEKNEYKKKNALFNHVRFLLSFFLLAVKQETPLSNLSQKEWETTTKNRVSIHDPSITSIHVGDQELFYVFGSHLAQAKPQIYKSWEVPFTYEYESMEDANTILW